MAAAANAKRSASMAAVHAAKKQKVDAGAGMGAGAGGVLQEAEVPGEAAAPKAEDESRGGAASQGDGAHWRRDGGGGGLK
jgi:hypothetical protein